MAESNETNSTPNMSAKTRAARIRKELAACHAMPESVNRITVKTKRASLMAAIDVKIHMNGPARVEIPDETYGTIWKLTDDALTAVHIAEDVGIEQGAAEWADGQNTFFTVNAIEDQA